MQVFSGFSLCHPQSRQIIEVIPMESLLALEVSDYLVFLSRPLTYASPLEPATMESASLPR